MTLFFLLSGFSCTLGYGKKNYKTTPSCCTKVAANTDTFDTFGYLFGRVTRILPVYYFSNLIALPLIPLGHSYFPPSAYIFSIGGSLSALFLVQTWIIILKFGPLGPSWTVATLFTFYLTFPK